MNTSTKPLFIPLGVAPFREVDTWLRFWWLKVPKPRVVSMITGVGYLILTLTGVATLVIPPQTYVGATGPLLMNLVGVFLTGGGLVGMIGGMGDFWQLERVGIAAMVVGVGAYSFIMWVLHNTTEGSRLTQEGMIGAALVFLFLRLALIWRYDFKPRG